MVLMRVNAAIGDQPEKMKLTSALGSQLDHLLSRDSVQDVLDLMQRKFGSNAGGA